MKTIRLLLVVALISFFPTQAYALEGWWDWLDALSGPGPYHGIGFGQTLFCKSGSDDNFRALCWRDEAEQRQVVEARASWLVWGGGQKFEDDPSDTRNVNAFSFDVFYLFRNITDLDIDVGPGLGLIRYSGNGFEPIYRFTFSPLSFSIAPLARSETPWVRRIRVRLDSMYVPQGFSGRDFDNFVTSFETSGEFLTRMAVIYRF